jgi:Holliday junction resolvase RusA-like endonuclease
MSISIDDIKWLGINGVRGRAAEDVWQFEINEVTSQARVYKQSLHEFFRTQMPLRPKWGEFEVDIQIHLNPNFPQIDVDNVAKAVLDGIKSHVFVDDSQIMRLLVEKLPSESEKLFIVVRKR